MEGSEGQGREKLEISEAVFGREDERFALREFDTLPGIEAVSVRAWIAKKTSTGVIEWVRATSGFLQVQTVGATYSYTAWLDGGGQASARMPEAGAHFFSDAFLNGRTARPLRVELSPPPWGSAMEAVVDTPVMLVEGHDQAINVLCEYSDGAYLYIEDPVGAVVPWYWLAPERRDTSCSNPSGPDVTQRRSMRGNLLLCRQGLPQWSWVAVEGAAWRRVPTQCAEPSPKTVRLEASGSLDLTIAAAEGLQGQMPSPEVVQLELREVSSPFAEGPFSIARPLRCVVSKVPSSLRIDNLPVGQFQIRADGFWQPMVFAVDIVQGQVSTVDIALEAQGSPLTAIRGRILVPGEALGDEWRRGRLWPVPVTWEGYAAPHRLELHADARDPSVYEFLASGLQPGRYRFDFEGLGWSETVTLSAGKEEVIEGTFSALADVRIHLFDEESGAEIQSAAVYLNGNLDYSATLKPSRAANEKESDDGLAGDNVRTSALAFNATVGESLLIVQAQGYVQAESVEWLHPGLNVISMVLKPTYPVWIRFSQPVGPALQEWALGVQVWRIGDSVVEFEVSPARFVGSELTHAYLEFPESGQYLLSWPRAGDSVAPVQLEVNMPRDRNVELKVPVEALEGA